jgi:hypothetical protein
MVFGSLIWRQRILHKAMRICFIYMWSHIYFLLQNVRLCDVVIVGATLEALNVLTRIQLNSRAHDSEVWLSDVIV